MKIKHSARTYRKPGFFAYGLARCAAGLASAFIFRRKVRRNELRQAKGGFIVIANHECALDFVNLIGLCPRRMTFVISRSFYSTLPFPRLLDRMGVIPKQQFQTDIADLRRMKAVVSAGQPLVIYPAGLMCEDGVSTPIPSGTWSLFNFLDVDVYMARTTGAYHVMPKWGKGFRPGRTYMDVYRLFSREELATLSKDEIRARAETALSFNAYAEQEELRVRYHRGDIVEGLENVLYRCPVCGEKHTIRAARNTLSCTACGMTATADRYGFLTGSDPAVPRYASDWNQGILARLKSEIPTLDELALPCDIFAINPDKHAFEPAGNGTVTLSAEDLTLTGTLGGEPLAIAHRVTAYPSLPFSPGKYFEVQDGADIYRVYPHEGKYVMEFINLLKLRHLAANEKLAHKEGEKKNGQ